MTEHRFREIRVQGRRLSGVLMPYNTEAVVEGVRERFLPRAFAPVPALLDLNLQHDAKIIMVKDAELIDTEQELRVLADLDPDGAASRLVRRGTLAGLSVEFAAQREQVVNGVRVVELATLAGAGLVDQGAYDKAVVEVRAKGRTVKGIFPGWQKRAECRCQGDDCEAVIFDRGAFDAALEDPGREVLGVAGNYDAPVASRRRGSLRIEQTDTGVKVEIDLTDGTASAKAVEDAAAVGDIYTRPYIDLGRSQYVDEGEPGQKIRRFSLAWLRAVVIGASDAVDGLTAAKIVAAAGRSAEPDPEVIQMPRMRRWR